LETLSKHLSEEEVQEAKRRYEAAPQGVQKVEAKSLQKERREQGVSRL
jgi:hypothetical protein